MALETRPEPSSDKDEWDDCDSPLIAQNEGDNSGEVKGIQQFNIFDASIDGIKSDLVKPPKKRLVMSLQTRSKLNITLHPPLPILRPYDQDEEKLLSPSFLLASRNLISHDYVLSAQQSVDNALPYFFYGAQMFPAILRGTSNMAKPLKDIITNMTPAIVYGVRRHALQGRSWPAAYQTQQSDDSIVGMLVFSVPEYAQISLDRFQGGSSARRVMRASFNLDDGKSCATDCYVYVTEQRAGLSILRHEDRVWRVSQLMQDPWHTQNLSSARKEEMLLQADL